MKAENSLNWYLSKSRHVHLKLILLFSCEVNKKSFDAWCQSVQVSFKILLIRFVTSLFFLTEQFVNTFCERNGASGIFRWEDATKDKQYVSLRLRVQNAVSPQPGVGQFRISLVLFNFLDCNFRLWFETP